MGISSGAAAYRLQFQISPIIMTGGIAGSIIGGVLPVLSLASALTGGSLVDTGGFESIDDFFGWFQPLPGSTMIEQQIGMYPFANQYVAANATIQQPLTLSMLMICPAGRGAGYSSKFALMQSIRDSFDQHNKSGGLYDVMTPSFVYTDLVMTSMTDVSSSSTKQVQNTYKLDFLKPLVSLAAAAGAYSSLMSQISGGVPTNGALSGLSPSVGTPIGSNAPAFIPDSSNQGAIGIGGSGGDVPLLS